MKANLLALILGVLIAILCSEVILRISPPPFMADELYHNYDPDVGWILRPIHGGRTSSACVNINSIQVNSLGFRDEEWHGKYRIAVLGDSFMQGSQLPEGTLVPQVLKSLLGVPVMNTGIAGFGTLHEYLVYKKYVARYQPKIVLLFFYPVNDVADNSGRLWTGTMRPMPRAYMDKVGNISVSFPNVIREDSRLRTFIKHVKTALLIRRAYDYASAINIEGPNVHMGGVYLPEDDVWREAWEVTEYYLVKLKQEIANNGGKLFLVIVPEYIQLAPEWEEDLKAYHHIMALPEGFSRQRPLRKLETIAKVHDMQMIRLDQFFLEYRDRFALPAPYFYYRCDGHLNPMGHFLAANIIAKYLLARNEVETDLSVIERNLSLDPNAILSTDGYGQIYKGGRFTGTTNIPALMRE